MSHAVKPKRRKKIDLKPPKFIPQGTRKIKIKARSQQKKGKIRAERKERDPGKMIDKINETKTLLKKKKKR